MGRLKRVASRVLIVAALVTTAALAAILTGSGATQRAQAAPLAATIDLTQTCSVRVEPGAVINVVATVTNTGDVQFLPPVVDGDAGTPDNLADDFVMTRGGGDTNGNNLLDPGEAWSYAGSYHALNEDTTDVAGVDAITGTGTTVSDIAPCTTDVVQPPVAGVLVRVEVVSGRVLVKRPGSNKFVALTGTTEIPIGSQVDTTHGTLRLTSALGGGRTNTADFYAGIFQILQRRANNAVTLIRLTGGKFGVCRRRRRSSAQSVSGVEKTRRPVRRVWGSGKGRFATQGRYSSATVRGTKWLTQDQCNGTLTRVVRGIVLVHVFRTRKNVNVRAGHSYLAPSP